MGKHIPSQVLNHCTWGREEPTTTCSSSLPARPRLKEQGEGGAFPAQLFPIPHAAGWDAALSSAVEDEGRGRRAPAPACKSR